LSRRSLSQFFVISEKIPLARAKKFDFTGSGKLVGESYQNGDWLSSLTNSEGPC